MVKFYHDKKAKWYIYMLEINCHGTKEHYFGKKIIIYTGISLNLGSRRGDYLYRRNKNPRKIGFVNKFRFSRKRLVYVEYFEGTEEEVMVRENKIKDMTRVKKKELIDSMNNMFIREIIPKRTIILRRILEDGIQEQYLVDIE